VSEDMVAAFKKGNMQWPLFFLSIGPQLASVLVGLKDPNFDEFTHSLMLPDQFKELRTSLDKAHKAEGVSLTEEQRGDGNLSDIWDMSKRTALIVLAEIWNVVRHEFSGGAIDREGLLVSGKVKGNATYAQYLMPITSLSYEDRIKLMSRISQILNVVLEVLKEAAASELGSEYKAEVKASPSRNLRLGVMRRYSRILKISIQKEVAARFPELSDRVNASFMALV